MLKEFMLIFAFILFILSAYYVIQYTYGKETPRNGIIAIISLLGSVSYPIYYFSSLNSANKVQQVADVLFPIPALLHETHALHQEVRQTGSQLVDSAIGGTANGLVAYGSTALVAVASAPYIPGLATILAGPLGWLIIPVFAFLLGITRDNTRRFRIYGGKHSKMKA